MSMLRVLACVTAFSSIAVPAPAFAQARPAGASTFTITTWNIGPGGTAADLAGLIRRSDAIALQEAGDQQRMIARVLPRHWGLSRSEKPYQVLIYNKRKLRLIRTVEYFLTPATNVGDAGAGGPWQGQKRIVGGHFRHPATGRRFSLGCVHLVPTQYIPIRSRLALRQTARIADWTARRRGLTMVAGDYNADPSSSVFNAMRRVGLVNDHGVLGKVGTFRDGRALDHVWYEPRPRRFRPVDHVTIPTASDHRALVMRFRVTPRT